MKTKLRQEEFNAYIKFLRYNYLVNLISMEEGTLFRKRIMLDGLDGSGKGTLAKEIASRLPGESVIIDYPQYDLPWGKVLRHLLDVSDKGLSIENRMLIYALNRAETIIQLLEVITENPQVHLIFDRGPTSNILTMAYYYTKLPDSLKPSGDDLERWVIKHYTYMREIDSTFYSVLGLSETPVFVPMLNSAETITSITQDSSRQGYDSYETIDVQEIARYFYTIIDKSYPKVLHLFSQYNDDGNRLTPEQQSIYVLESLGYSAQEENPSVRRFVGEIPRDLSIVNKLLEEFGSDQLRGLNPYIIE